MRQRAPLRSKIIAAWCRTIQRDYGKINSERSLQASFWANLFRSFKRPELRQIFIEPHITLADGQIVFPDLVVCNSKTVIAVIELKYLPRTAAKFQKDLGTLQSISQQRTKIHLSNVRYQGDQPPQREFQFAGHVLFVWAGVYSGSHPKSLIEEWLPETSTKGFETSFLELHALTQKNESPKVKWKPTVPSDHSIQSKFKSLMTN